MSIDAMKQALAALEEIADEVFSPYDNKLGDAILALRAAIEQAQEPVGHADLGINNIYIFSESEPRVAPVGRTPLYTSPRQWHGLTDEEIVRRKKVKPILVRIMQEAYDLADRDDSEGYNSVKVMCSEVLGMINKLLDERQWQGLTDEEVKHCYFGSRADFMDYARAIEAKLKEKNA